jgi:glucose-1-phosphate cytidylyltransferase
MNPKSRKIILSIFFMSAVIFCFPFFARGAVMEVTVTITSVQPDGRFGALEIDEANKVTLFTEKLKGDGAWINGGYFVCQPEVLDYIENDETVFEQEPLMNLATEGNIFTYQHHGFWRCMDTLRDKQQLNSIWDKGNAPWKKW